MTRKGAKAKTAPEGCESPANQRFAPPRATAHNERVASACRPGARGQAPRKHATGTAGPGKPPDHGGGGREGGHRRNEGRIGRGAIRAGSGSDRERTRQGRNSGTTPSEQVGASRIGADASRQAGSGRAIPGIPSRTGEAAPFAGWQQRPSILLPLRRKTEAGSRPPRSDPASPEGPPRTGSRRSARPKT